MTTRQLVLPVPLAKRRGHAAGAANRRQLLVGDDDDLLDALERVEDGGVRTGNVEHDVAVVALGHLQQRPNTANVERRRHHPFRRGQQVDAGLRLDDQISEERLVEAMRVLERIDNGEPRFGTKEHGGITVGDMKVHQQRAARHEPRQRGCHVDGDGGGAHAAFCANKRQRHTAVRCQPIAGPPAG